MADTYNDIQSKLNNGIDLNKLSSENKSSEIDIDFQFDELQIYFGDDYKLNDYITIHQPTIGEIVRFGEQRTFASITPFTGNTTMYRLQLWDAGIDWNEITDYQLFVMLSQNLKQKDTSLIFGDLDFSSLIQSVRNDNGTLVLVDNLENPKIYIDEMIYLQIREYLRNIFDQHPKVEKAKGKFTKEALIDEDRMNLQAEMRKNTGVKKSFLLPLISALLNHPGFKYKKNELLDCGLVEFIDSVKRLQIYESSVAFMHGMYSGMMDTSSMNKTELNKQLNWMRSLSD